MDSEFWHPSVPFTPGQSAFWRSPARIPKITLATTALRLGPVPQSSRGVPQQVTDWPPPSYV
jgi:hypothetical protein